MTHPWKLKATSLALAAALACTGGTAAAAEVSAAKKKPLTKCDNTPLSERISCLSKMGRVSVYAIPTLLIIGHAMAEEDRGASDKAVSADIKKHVGQYVETLKVITAIEESSPTAKAEIKRLRVKADKQFTDLLLGVEDSGKKAWALGKAVYYGTLAVSRFADFISDPGLHKDLEDINKGFNKMSGALDKMNKGVDQINRGLKKMNKGIDKANSGLTETNKGITEANKAMGDLRKVIPEFVKAAEGLNKITDRVHIDFPITLKGIVSGKSPLENANVRAGLSTLLDLVPGIGDGKGILEGITGKDKITGKGLSGTDRVLGSVVLLRWMKAGKKVITAEDLTKAMKAEKATGKVDGWLPKSAYDKIPASLKEFETLNKKGVGYRWNDGKGNGVRIDKGEASNPQKYQQVDHVVVNSGGKIIGRDGKAIGGSIKDNPRAAHIPVSEWVKWKAWNKP
ncbi:pre-toxin TG domain-containing protein [Streptomyces alboflavus]|uniref:pre-toxin TG domain-containing protein n=1 Tax=Streptomyces alboflavus TaxID=67267 RepID=UPI000998AF05|nr:pre-toxin TG domain-containing protein [Streptomyces alboflavus]